MDDKMIVLGTAYSVIRHEYDSINRLLTQDEKNPLGEYTGPIRGKLSRFLAQARTLLNDIEAAKEAGQLVSAWNGYVELRTKVMPALSSELLAVIGGMHLMQAQLDDARKPELGKQDKRFTSFSRLAQQLVEDLVERTVGDWVQVLIVGEERLGLVEAEIIRLRFPAYGIWNLPFTAHEYGYLMAQRRPPDSFRDFRDEVRLSVNPAKHDLGSPPERQACFLKDVQDLWQVYHSDELDPDGRADLLKKKKREIDELANRQQAHLCRLFADAFATFFVGPAYVYTLLHLSFIPDSTLYEPTISMPPFAHRFCIALETLKWMNEKPIPSSAEPGLFDEELDEQTGIPHLWRQTLESADQEDHYNEVLQAYEFWFERVKELLKDQYNTKSAIDRTYEDWRIAKEVDQLAEMEPEPRRTRPPMWAILNAAWSARMKSPERTDLIHDNALSLLDIADPKLVQRVSKRIETAGGGRGDKEREQEKRAQAIKIVEEALQSRPDLLDRFHQMQRSEEAIKLDSDILQHLKEDQQATDCYRWLCGMKGAQITW